MRMLPTTGWLNFRMRAMLMSVASYQLWLDWRPTGLHLARLFTDYEPGIHWPQAQMQAGTPASTPSASTTRSSRGWTRIPTAASSVAGARNWRPCPCAGCTRPGRCAQLEQEDARCRIGRDYPLPVVDHVASARQAREAVWGVRRKSGFASAADDIQARHGSRRSGLPQPTKARGRPERQLSLGL